MKKIIVEFKTLNEIKRLKIIMKNVYSSKSDHLPDIIRFNLGKIFTPESVDRAELHITTNAGNDVVTIAKSSLTYLIGEYPFTKIHNASNEEGKYIVLPWDISSNLGKDNLKNLINRIKENTQSLKYIIYIRTDLDLNQSMTSLAGLNLSNIIAEDNTEILLSRIEELELKLQKLNECLLKAEKEIEIQKNLISQKQQNINSLNNQVAELSKNDISWDTRVKNQTTFEFIGFTGKLKTIIDPYSGTMTFNVT